MTDTKPSDAALNDLLIRIDSLLSKSKAPDPLWEVTAYLARAELQRRAQPEPASQAAEAPPAYLGFALYDAINNLVSLFGKHGVVDRRHAEVDAVMDALYSIDSGKRMNAAEWARQQERKA